MQKDIFGRPANSMNYGDRFRAVEWDDTSTPGVIYLRGDYANPCIIKRIDNNNRTVKWARGNWTSRTILSYGDDRMLNVGV